VVDARADGRKFTAEAVRAITDRVKGVGADQFIVMEKPAVPGVDVFMRIYNADGGEIDACGNASRCVAALVAEELGKQAIMLQNMYLARQAMGLGGWIFTSSVGQFVMQLMGFNFQASEKGPIKPLIPGPRVAAVGLDGVFQSYCPPYYPDMDSACQAIFDAKWGKQGIYKEDGKPVAWKDRQALDKLVNKTPQWCLDATKAMAQYIWETYGRFPATIDPMEMNIWFQAHHLETDFYDEFYQPGSYHQAVKDHMGVWHESH
jgi:hypothetical protein